MILFLALSPSVDVTYEVDELVVGGITRPRAITRVAGGKTLNAARVARQLGADVRIIAALGGYPGDWIEAQVALTRIPLAADTRTCFAISDGATTSTDLYEPATPLTAAEWDAFAAAARAERPDWVAVSGSMPPGVGDLAGVLADLRAAGARVALDSSGAGLASLIGSADLVKVNRHEASELLGADVTAAEACALLRERHGVDAVVTDGTAGGAALVGGVSAVIPPPARRGAFPAGSGDAFLGALLTAVDGPLGEALAVASDAAVRNALVPGQGILSSRA